MIVDRTGGGNALLGSVLTIDGKAAVRMESRYSTDIEDLWSAVTEPQRLARWLAQVEGDFRLGGEFWAIFASGAAGSGRIDVCEPPRRLMVTLSPGNVDESVVEALLTADGDHTRLVLEERYSTDFHDDPAAQCAGWQVHLEDLTAYFAGRDRGDWQLRWTELTPAYRERFAR
jgi:uncharacterized protein YndB with AHSA1/START domain